MRARLPCVVALLVLLAAVPSRATTVYVTSTGTVSSGTDNLGLFGTPGANLAGSTFQTNYVFDVTFGLHNDECNNCAIGTGSYSYIIGGPAAGVLQGLSPSLGASISIGGTTVAVDGSYYGQIVGRNDG